MSRTAPGPLTLQARLAQAAVGGALRPGLAAVIAALAASTQRISALVGKGGIGDILGSAGQQNVQGEVQKKLDVISNDMMVEGLSATGHLLALASEEMDHHLPMPGPHAAERLGNRLHLVSATPPPCAFRGRARD
jgi:fructose-1,6-bisphosphatase I